MRTSPLLPSAGVLGALLLILFARQGEPPREGDQPSGKPAPPCTADISHPLQVRVVPPVTVHPGGEVTARIEVTARQMLENVTVRVEPDVGARIRSPRVFSLGRMRQEETRGGTVRVITPTGGVRSTVQIAVEASLDGEMVTRGAVLNLIAEGEASRVVETPEGRRVREVRARRFR